jgi:indolepyruvate ferredoxin oxidoreductase
MMTPLRVLARLRRLRGTRLDLFGYTHERRVERELIAHYMQQVQGMLPRLRPERMKTACEIAALPLTIRGYGHVKLANLAMANAREGEMLHRFDPEAYPRPVAAPTAGQIRGIPVVSA